MMKEYKITIQNSNTIITAQEGSHLLEVLRAHDLAPEAPCGADVISRIQAALNGQMDELTDCIREGLYKLTIELCQRSGTTASAIGVVSMVGNPCMQQLFLGILPL